MFLSDSSLLQTHILKSIDSRFQNLCGWAGGNSIGRSPCLPLMRKVAKPQVLTEGEITHLSGFHRFSGSATWVSLPQSSLRDAPSSEGARETANCAFHLIKLKSVINRTAFINERRSRHPAPSILIPYFPVIRFANSSTPLPTSASEFSDVSILRISSLVAS